MQKVEISARTIIFTVFFLIFLRVLWSLKELLFSLLLAFIFMSALSPSVRRLEEWKVRRTLAVFLVYFSFVLVVIALFSLILPPILIETGNLVKSLPLIIKGINTRTAPWLQLDAFTQYIPTATNEILKLVTGFASNIFFIISTLFFGFYLLLQEKSIKLSLSRYLDESTTLRVSRTIDHAEERMSSWFWGELKLMTIVGLMSFAGLSLIGIKYVLPLAVLAGLLEVVPNIGPILSSLPAVLLGFSHSYLLGFSAMAVYVLVQQLENNLIVPVVMSRAVGLNPIITLIVLIVGGKFGGVLGILLAIPTFLFIESIVLEVLKGNDLAEKLR
ncbi:AI-2E family transporter [Candidatus Roizmanbacteria bacterium]|nr:AI-2E family transporter [Candidatus Roizmanbacteria bacterium]